MSNPQPITEASFNYPLFKHMSDNHGLTLLESEMAEIVEVVLSYNKSKDQAQRIQELEEKIASLEFNLADANEDNCDLRDEVDNLKANAVADLKEASEMAKKNAQMFNELIIARRVMNFIRNNMISSARTEVFDYDARLSKSAQESQERKEGV